MHQLKKSACGLIEGKFVNTRVLLGLFMQNRQHGCLRGCRHTFRHVQEKFFRPLKFVNMLLEFLLSDIQGDPMKQVE